MELVVTRLSREAEDVRGVELQAEDASELPAFTAGAHIDLYLPGGVVRQYSLLNDPQERTRYCLGIGLAPASRGGSRYVHQNLQVGHKVRVGPPRSLFGIEPAATEHVFIAGGIGITPILSMIRWCIARERPWRLLYGVRSRSRAAFLWDLAPHRRSVMLHVDEESQDGFADLRGFLDVAPPGAHVYCCGPSPLMNAVADAGVQAGFASSALHFERFSGESRVAKVENADKPFDIVLRQSGHRFTVPAGISILETLENHGMGIPCSCREGLCRTCEVPLLQGAADHRDYVLTDEERAANNTILVCVSRARGGELVLDI